MISPSAAQVRPVATAPVVRTGAFLPSYSRRSLEPRQTRVLYCGPSCPVRSSTSHECRQGGRHIVLRPSAGPAAISTAAGPVRTELAAGAFGPGPSRPVRSPGNTYHSPPTTPPGSSEPSNTPLRSDRATRRTPPLIFGTSYITGQWGPASLLSYRLYALSARPPPRPRFRASRRPPRGPPQLRLHSDWGWRRGRRGRGWRR